VNPAIPPIISAATVLVGTGGLEWARDRRRAARDARADLVDNLAELGIALDILIAELGQRPTPSAWILSFADLIARFLPSLDFAAGRLSFVLFDRKLSRATERMQVAANRLLITAPESVLKAIEPVSTRLASYDPGDGAWLDSLRRDRAELAAASRGLLA
jgi:hypothetical protein